MIPLPICRHRGQENPFHPDRYVCRSPRVAVFDPRGVDGDLCRQCPFADHDLRDGEQQKPEPPKLHNIPQPIVGGGPGSELKAMLAQIGVHSGGGCDCNAKANQMDAWGVDGCVSNRDKIVSWIREGSPRWGWMDKVKAAVNAKTSGLLADLRKHESFAWTDPYPALVDEAIHRARKPIELMLHNGQSPGDILVMTAAIESLHRLYPGKYLTAVDSPVPEIFENNPNVVPVSGTARLIEMQYPLIHQSDALQVHFMDAYCDFLGKALGLSLPRQVDRPQLFISDEEAKRSAPAQDYWLINAGVKLDFTAKQYPHYQRVVDLLASKINFVQIGEVGHLHKPLTGVIDMIGRTSTRELIRLAYHAKGGVGPSTFLQHICASLNKPYVCLLGGREPLAWVKYPRQTTLHSFGTLDCCTGKACWKSRTVPMGDGDPKDSCLCERPWMVGGMPSPECLASIAPETVVRAILEHQ